MLLSTEEPNTAAIVEIEDSTKILDESAESAAKTSADAPAVGPTNIPEQRSEISPARKAKNAPNGVTS